MCVPVGPRRVWREALARTSTDKKRPAWGLVGARLPHARPPPLDVAAERVRPEWMREWISNPNRLFPYNQLMPQNFANDQKEKKDGKEISKQWLESFYGSPGEQAQAVRDALMDLPEL